jgi:GTP 3',8-cyclase
VSGRVVPVVTTPAGQFKILEDSFQRRITYLRVSITDRCNLRCTYCMPAEGIDWKDRDEILSYEELYRIIRIAVQRGLKKVRVTGGEPTVRRGLAEFVAKLNSLKSEGLEEIAMTTNGILLKHSARSLYDAGLRHLNISIDSLDPETFHRVTRGDVFDRVWEGLEEAERVGFDPIKINAVLQKGINTDDGEVDRFIDLLFQKSYEIRFIEFMPCANWEQWQKEYKGAVDVRGHIEAKYGKLEQVREPNEGHNGPARVFQVPGAKGRLGFITAVSDAEHFCDRCNRVRLSADGKIRPCLFSDIEVDFREALRRHCQDQEIHWLFDQVMGIKPERHKLDDYAQEKMLTSMISIGG